MAPKKKGNKRQEEDWEADLGESAPTTAAPADEEPQEDANEDAAPVGGLMAALRKNKAKKAKKGKVNDFVEGEDPESAAADDLASKQPEEGNFDDDDVFAGKKTKPIKEVAKPAPEPQPEGEFRVKSKKEKEREKKEKEKQRKKEQVGFHILSSCWKPVLGVKIIY
jgi:translation initiation factor 5B